MRMMSNKRSYGLLLDFCTLENFDKLQRTLLSNSQ